MTDATPICYTSRSYTSKRIGQVKAASGKNQTLITAVSVPAGAYNVYMQSMFAIAELFPSDDLVGPDYHISLSVGGDNPLFANLPNRCWQEQKTFSRGGTYACIGGLQLNLNHTTNTLEAATGLRDEASPILLADGGYDDAVIFVFQISLLLTLTAF